MERWAAAIQPADHSLPIVDLILGIRLTNFPSTAAITAKEKPTEGE
jgi:hypothetical protein